jgi:hypothetical protein
MIVIGRAVGDRQLADHQTAQQFGGFAFADIQALRHRRNIPGQLRRAAQQQQRFQLRHRLNAANQKVPNFRWNRIVNHRRRKIPETKAWDRFSAASPCPQIPGRRNPD